MRQSRVTRYAVSRSRRICVHVSMYAVTLAAPAFRAVSDTWSHRRPGARWCAAVCVRSCVMPFAAEPEDPGAPSSTSSMAGFSAALAAACAQFGEKKERTRVSPQRIKG